MSCELVMRERSAEKAARRVMKGVAWSRLESEERESQRCCGSGKRKAEPA